MYGVYRTLSEMEIMLGFQRDRTRTTQTDNYSLGCIDMFVHSARLLLVFERFDRQVGLQRICVAQTL